MIELIAIVAISTATAVLTGLGYVFVRSRPLRQGFVRRTNEIGLIGALCELMS